MASVFPITPRPNLTTIMTSDTCPCHKASACQIVWPNRAHLLYKYCHLSRHLRPVSGADLNQQHTRDRYPCFMTTTLAWIKIGMTSVQRSVVRRCVNVNVMMEEVVRDTIWNSLKDVQIVVSGERRLSKSSAEITKSVQRDDASATSSQSIGR